jgi:hypothetical protein
MVPSIDLNEAKKFSNIWNFNGVVVPLDNVSLTFARDFANVVLKSFFIQAEANMAKVIEAQVQLRLTEERNKQGSSLIIEG